VPTAISRIPQATRLPPQSSCPESILERAAILPGRRLFFQSLSGFERRCDVDLGGRVISSETRLRARCRPLLEIASSYYNR
jgi:hypothetical protein